MRILLTGASGTLGRHLAGLLSGDADVELFIAGRSDWANPNLLIGHAQPDTVIHSAACGVERPRPDPLTMVDFNVGATLRLFRACPSAHFVFIGSALAYIPQGRPLSEDDPLGSTDTYAASKGSAEWLLRTTALADKRRLTVIRPFGFTGQHDRPSRL